jgi:hypothetical protein
MGLVTVAPSSSNLVLDQYHPSKARPDRFYATTLWGGAKGPFTITRREQDGKVAFYLQPPLTVNEVEWVTEYPPIKRIEATDGAYLDRPTPLQAFEFLHHHVTADVTIFL